MAQEMGDDLNRLSEESREKRGFRSCSIDGPGNASVLGQADIALRTKRVAGQKQMVSHLRSNVAGCHRVRNRAEINLLPGVVMGFFLRVDGAGNSQNSEYRQ